MFLELVNRSSKSFFQFNVVPDKFTLYVKGVYVKSVSIALEKMLYSLKLEEFKVNIVMDNIIPNVSRDDIQEEIEKRISTAIYQAICIGIYQNLKDPVEKETLLEYLKKFRYHQTIFLKEKYKNMLC